MAIDMLNLRVLSSAHDRPREVRSEHTGKALGAIAATISLLLGGTACSDSTSGSGTALEM